jgi:glutathione S-transferase
MELYTAGTGNGQRAAIAVNECGIQCTMHVLNLAQGDQKKPDYLKINPTARIPTLIDPDGPGGKPLTLIQSWAILYYLAEKTGRLIPSDPLGTRPDLPMARRSSQRHGPDRAEHLFPRQPDAGEGAGIGNQVLRGPARHPIPRRRRPAWPHAISHRQ